MKKEFVWAIIVGFGLGLIITWGVWTAKRGLKTTPSLKTQNLSPTPTSAPITLKIDQPEDESIIKTDQTVVAGKTDPDAILAILTEEGEIIIKADNEGKFETEVSLVEGANEINIIAFDDEGNQASQSMTVVYSNAEL